LVAVHAIVAMIVTVVIGVVLAGELGHILRVSQNRWVDIPYAPLIWGTALLFAYLLKPAISKRGAGLGLGTGSGLVPIYADGSAAFSRSTLVRRVFNRQGHMKQLFRVGLPEMS